MVIGDRMQAMTIKELRNKYTSTNVRWGRAKTQTLSTELDSSTIIITNSDKLNIESYDIVELTNEYNVNEYWLVADKKEEYITFSSPFKYQYTIELMSLTKLFETIFLPSMTITNIGQNRTIYFYINTIISQYFKTSYGFSVSIANRLQTKANVVCKENTFSEPTMREYLDWLLSSVGAISTLRIEKSSNVYSFVVDYLDLSGSNVAITTSYITDIFTGQDSDSYVSRILQTSDDIISEQTITEYLKESTTEPILNTDTAQLRLTRKAYDFKSLKAFNVKFTAKLKWASKFQGSYTDGTYYNSANDNDVPGTATVDISDLVVSTEEYSTLVKPNKNIYKTNAAGSLPEAFYTTTSKKYLVNTITWDRDSNTITNLHYLQTWKTLWIEDNSGTSIENILRRAVWLWFKTNYPNKGFNDSYYKAGTWPDDRFVLESESEGDYDDVWWEVDVDYDYDEQMFAVEYQPYYSPKIVEEHEKSNAIYSTDTNTNAKTDILLQLDRNKEKLNQLACDYKIMTAISKVTNSNYTPKISIGQYWMDENNNKYVLTKLETVINSDFIQYKGTLSLNFSNTIIDTSLNREKRYYAYANTNIVTRKENLVKIFKICLSNSVNEDLPLIPGDSCRITFLYNNHPIGYYLLPLVKVYNDRMISFEIQTMDNISITSVKGESITGGYQNNVLKYVNENAEFNRITVDFGMLKEDSTNEVVGKTPIDWASDIDISECGHEETISGAISIWIDESENLFHKLSEKYTLDILKDNREQFNLTVQFIPKAANLIQNSTATIDFYFDRYINTLELYYQASKENDTPTKPFRCYMTWTGGSSDSYLTLSELFDTNFIYFYTAQGGTNPTGDNIRIRILGSYLSGTMTQKTVIDIQKYTGGYLTPEYEDFI